MGTGLEPATVGLARVRGISLTAAPPFEDMNTGIGEPGELWVSLWLPSPNFNSIGHRPPGPELTLGWTASRDAALVLAEAVISPYLDTERADKYEV